MTTEAPDLTPAYIGKEPGCGCVVAVTVDLSEPSIKKAVAKDIADWVRSGLDIEHTTVEDARVRLRRCTHQPEPAPTKRKAAKR